MVSLVGRIMLCTIFLLSALANKIPNFRGVASVMAKEGIPAPQFMLVGAIVFLIAGSLSIVLGFKARFGAVLLLAFLILATYFFHDFWTMEGKDQQEQMIQFMKNLGLMGAMLLIIANGSGAWSLDNRARPTAIDAAS
jgi:putative oxidoreductase